MLRCAVRACRLVRDEHHVVQRKLSPSRSRADPGYTVITEGVIPIETTAGAGRRVDRMWDRLARRPAPSAADEALRFCRRFWACRTWCVCVSLRSAAPDTLRPSVWRGHATRWPERTRLSPMSRVRSVTHVSGTDTAPRIYRTSTFPSDLRGVLGDLGHGAMICGHLIS